MTDIQLHILSPEGELVQALAELVTLPGIVGPFTVLPGHAALVTALVAGDIRYVSAGKEERVPIREGFVQVRDNVIKACVEI